MGQCPPPSGSPRRNRHCVGRSLAGGGGEVLSEGVPTRKTRFDQPNQRYLTITCVEKGLTTGESFLPGLSRSSWTLTWSRLSPLSQSTCMRVAFLPKRRARLSSLVQDYPKTSTPSR